MHCLSDHYLFYVKIIIIIATYIIVTLLLKFCIPSVSASGKPLSLKTMTKMTFENFGSCFILFSTKFACPGFACGVFDIKLSVLRKIHRRIQKINKPYKKPKISRFCSDSQNYSPILEDI